MNPENTNTRELPSPPSGERGRVRRRDENKAGRGKFFDFPSPLECLLERRHPPQPFLFHAQTKAFARAQLLVRCFYACGLFFAVALLPDWTGLLARNSPAPLWPVAWLPHVHLRAGITAILLLHLGGALAAALFSGKRWARVMAFLGLLEYAAFNNSYGKIGHSLHLWMLVSGLLIFLPDVTERSGLPSRAVRQRFLLVFWSCQAMAMLVYSMSGLGKMLGAIYQLGLGQTNAFMPDALAAIVAERLVETNSHSLLGPWLINHPLAGWPLLLGDIYLQLFAFVAVFRPSLQKLWAFGLILFHIGTYLLMTISFPENALLLALLFINSPFHREDENWRHTLADLPLFGRLFPRPCAS